MTSLKLEIPAEFLFQTTITVRVDDLNYSNHLSNDVYLKYMQETRMQFLNHLGLNELNIGGCGIIMGEATIRFQQECFYGDRLLIEITATNFGNKSFDFFYRITKSTDGSPVCIAKTGMVCYDYQTQTSAIIPESFKNLIDNKAI
jgi:acyl-CoA thioester hydrolase